MSKHAAKGLLLEWFPYIYIYIYIYCLFSSAFCLHYSFFLEKNMLLFFLKIMTQNCGTYVTVQLLQTLNILFENMRHETSICEYTISYFVDIFYFNNKQIAYYHMHMNINKIIQKYTKTFEYFNMKYSSV